MRNTAACALALIATLGCATAGAAPGDADPSFSADGFATARFDTTEGVGVRSVAVQHDGKTVAAVAVLTGGGHLGTATFAYYLTRFNRDGSVDTGFGRDGTAALPGGSSPYYFSIDIALQRDDQIVVVKASPETLAFPDENRIWVGRYTTSGRADLSFGGGDGAFTHQVSADTCANASSLAITPSDAIVIGGSVGDVGDNCFGDAVLAKLTPDGEVDAAFAGGGVWVDPRGELSSLYGLAVDSASRIVALASNTGSSPGAVLRYSPDGAFDPSFSGDGLVDLAGIVDRSAADLAVDPDDRPLVAASEHDQPASQPAQIARLTTSGTPDPGFGVQGVATPAYPPRVFNFYAQSFSQIAVDEAGRVMFASLDLALVTGRLTPSGTPDPTYSMDGWSRLYVRRDRFGGGPVGDLAAGPEGLVVGIPSQYDDAATLARLSLREDGVSDSDGDSRLDLAERCPYVFGHCPRFTRTANLFFDDPDERRGPVTVLLNGGVECFRAPEVSLYKVRPGRDLRVGRKRLRSRTYWRVDFELPKGVAQYYARVKRTVYGSGICSRAQSNFVNARNVRSAG